jgi:hypothetical protein
MRAQYATRLLLVNRPDMQPRRYRRTLYRLLEPQTKMSIAVFESNSSFSPNSNWSNLYLTVTVLIQPEVINHKHNIRKLTEFS